MMGTNATAPITTQERRTIEAQEIDSAMVAHGIKAAAAFNAKRKKN